MRIIDADELKEFPIRADHCDEEHGDEHFIYGIETVLEYAEHLPTVDAIPVEWLEEKAQEADEKKFKLYSEGKIFFGKDLGDVLRMMIFVWGKEKRND